MPKQDPFELLEVEGHQVRITNPDKPYFTRETKLSKIDIVRYYLSVAPGALQGIQDRPIVLKRFVNGAEQEPFYQKRAPSDLPAYLRTATLSFPSGRTAEEVVVDTAPGLAWIANLGCLELHPHPVRTGDLDHPDELRVDLDPGPGVEWPDVKAVALEVEAVLKENNLIGWPKTSGSRGIHINVRIHPQWTFTEVRRAALALARAVERRVPTLATSKWWKEERHGVFLDYNQNAKDRTTCSAYSVRPLPDARVSAPLFWHEVPQVEPADFTVLTMPTRFATLGNPHAEMDANPGGLEALLELAARDESEGLGDAPWPPHFSKQEGESKRVAPSKAKSFSSQINEGFGAYRFKKQSKAAEPDQSSADPSAEAKPARKARTSRHPLITISQSPDKAAAEAGLERWKLLYPIAAAALTPEDILVDRMRGASYVWYRIRVNLKNVPEPDRPPQQTPDPDDDPTRAWKDQEPPK
ncbi:DNA polymerase domain-containing protein [Granulicella tundricola]|uniref:DNA primase small subunit n=1 Tax=Granulicella tundricola (strain ATCC BAA-1859 / DSM 23138 / MP5ACTX9) TaxID=1198114 RepID=E8WXE9_GRATM|nr:DNA primase small subunit domain-containing protein [Granulicella tundricola]ADW67482.1 DNA primase small subunit [Granulicella tundricola MP5ACTX9]